MTWVWSPASSASSRRTLPCSPPLPRLPPLAGEAALIKKAFELKQGELGGPVETAQGIYIIKIKERKDAVVPPLADIKAAVEAKARAVKATELAKKKAEDAAKQFVAKAALKTQSTGSFGYSSKGDLPVIGNAPELMEAAFKLTTAAPAVDTPFKVGNRWYAVRLKQRAEAPKADFDKSKEELKKKILPQETGRGAGEVGQGPQGQGQDRDQSGARRRRQIVSVLKGSFFAPAASIFRITCAAYRCTPPRNPLISCPERKIPPFRIINQLFLIRNFRMETK